MRDVSRSSLRRRRRSFNACRRAWRRRRVPVWDDYHAGLQRASDGAGSGAASTSCSAPAGCAASAGGSASSSSAASASSAQCAPCEDDGTQRSAAAARCDATTFGGPLAAVARGADGPGSARSAKRGKQPS
eukprot:2166423-Prymnesium_polylepis.1